MESITLFLEIAKFAVFWWKNTDVSRIPGVFHVIHIFFGYSLGLGKVSLSKVSVPSFIIVEYVWQILRGGEPFCTLPSSPIHE